MRSSLLLLALLAACGNAFDPDGPGVDTDLDSDSDTDLGTEPDTDIDSDTLAPNTAPVVSIRFPTAAGGLTDEGPHVLVVDLTDDYTALDALDVQWTSSQDGELAGTWTWGEGTGSFALDGLLSLGEHTLVVSVEDEEGLSASASVVVTVDPLLVDADSDGFDETSDCNDNNASINPGAMEVPYDGVDNDCNPATRDDDLDNDGFVAAQDCDDEDAARAPDHSEVAYDGVDNDCDAGTPDDDLDGDGYVAAQDCDDEDAARAPDHSEIAYDGVDNDCDAGTPDDDLDGDGYVAAQDCDDEDATRAPDHSEVAYDGVDNDCDAGTPDDDLDGDGYVAAQDCDDEDAARAPDHSEIAYDGVDNDCDAGTPDDDLDGDGYVAAQDCDDEDPARAPDHSEIAYDGVDNDCDAGTPDDDLDGDGYVEDQDCDDDDGDVHPGVDDVCDGVDNDCDGTIDGAGSVPGSFSSIQAAVDAAPVGGTVCVAPGTYFEQLTLDRGDVSVVGAAGSAATVLDGGGAGPVVWAQDVDNVVIQGITVTGGVADDGAGAFFRRVDNLELVDVHSDNNLCHNDCRGVGLFLEGVTAVLDRVRATNNSVQVDANTTSHYVSGIGLYLRSSDILGVDVESSYNTATVGVAGRGAQLYGGGLYTLSTTLEVDGLRVVGNEFYSLPQELGHTVRGAGVSLYGPTVLHHAFVADNAGAAFTAQGGGLFVSDFASLVLTNSQVLGNRVGTRSGAQVGYGGGLYLEEGAPVSFDHVDLVGNMTNGSGGCVGAGLYRELTSTTPSIPFTNSLVVGNELQCDNGNGGAMAFAGSSTAQALVASYSLFFDNDAPAFIGFPTPYSHSGNLTVDPLFWSFEGSDPLAWDLHPSRRSPLIDAGHPDEDDADGSRANIGAHGGSDPL